MGFGLTPVSTTPLTTNEFPASAVYTPNTPNGDFTAVEGGPISTDGLVNKSAPISAYIKDGGDVTQGATTDAAWSGTGAGSEIAILKKLVALLSSTLSVSLPSLPAGSNTIGVVAFGGTVAVGVPSNSGVVPVKSSSGRLASVIVTGTGTTQLNLYDNASQASGTIIGAIPANAAIGSVYAFNSPAANGILANSVANCCSVTICYY